MIRKSCHTCLENKSHDSIKLNASAGISTSARMPSICPFIPDVSSQSCPTASIQYSGRLSHDSLIHPICTSLGILHNLPLRKNHVQYSGRILPPPIQTFPLASRYSTSTIVPTTQLTITPPSIHLPETPDFRLHSLAVDALILSPRSKLQHPS